MKEILSLLLAFMVALGVLGPANAAPEPGTTPSTTPAQSEELPGMRTTDDQARQRVKRMCQPQNRRGTDACAATSTRMVITRKFSFQCDCTVVRVVWSAPRGKSATFNIEAGYHFNVAIGRRVWADIGPAQTPPVRTITIWWYEQ